MRKCVIDIGWEWEIDVRTVPTEGKKGLWFKYFNIFFFFDSTAQFGPWSLGYHDQHFNLQSLLILLI
jgi:hypothetical protein